MILFEAHMIQISTFDNMGGIAIVVVYFDDLVIMRSNKELIQSCTDDLKKSFDMINLVLLHYYLGLEV